MAAMSSQSHTDPTKNATVLYERSIGFCAIVGNSKEQIEELLPIVKALKPDKIVIIVPAELKFEMVDMGYQCNLDYVIVEEM